MLHIIYWVLYFWEFGSEENKIVGWFFFRVLQHRETFFGIRAISKDIKKFTPAVTKQSYLSVPGPSWEETAPFSEGSPDQKGQEWIWGDGCGQQPILQEVTSSHYIQLQWEQVCSPRVLKISTGTRSTEHWEMFEQCGLAHTWGPSVYGVQMILSRILACRWSSLNCKAKTSLASIDCYWNHLWSKGHKLLCW